MSVQDPASEPLESQYFANSQGPHDRSRGNSLLATRYRRFFPLYERTPTRFHSYGIYAKSCSIKKGTRVSLS